MKKRYDLSIVVPCYNEEANVRALCQRVQTVLQQHGIEGEIIFVNDGSSDNTPALIQDLAIEYNDVIAIHHKKNRGMEAGWNTGVDIANGRYVCLIDADLQYLPEEIWRMYREIEVSQCDLVQGVRSSIGRMKDSRYLLSRVLNIALNILFNMQARDNKSGFVLAPKVTLQDILRHHYRYYYYQTFIRVSAEAKGYHVKEVEVLFQSRHAGESFINQFPALLVSRVVLDLFKGFIEYAIRKKRVGGTLHSLESAATIVHLRKSYEGYSLLRRLWLKVYFYTFPLHKWKITRHTEHFYKVLKRTQWLSSEAISDLQHIRLQRLMNHVYYHVPYYRNKMLELNLRPEDIKTIDDLEKIPLLSKKDVKENLYFDLFADNHRKKDMLEITTSGSTGSPFLTYADRTQLEMRWATTMRALEWTGWKLGDKQIRLWHQKINMSKSQVYREKIDAWFMRRRFVPAFELNQKEIQNLVTLIKSYKPKLIDGYAECFNFLARHLKTSDIDDLSIPAAMSSAQTLTKDTRSLIETGFKTKLFDKYGSREFSGIAYQCDQCEGYHVMAESYIVEILVDGRLAKPGEVGEIVVTDLNNFSVPLIRYRIGDLARAMDNTKPCDCGRGLPRISNIEGRVQSVITRTDGTLIPGTFFSHLIKDYYYAFKQYQIIQKDHSHIEVVLVKEEQFTKKAVEEIVAKIQSFLGKEMHINVRYVNNIPLTRTGKHLAVISEIDMSDKFSGQTSP